MTVEEITTHAADAVDRLPEQHKGKTEFPALVSILATPAQDAETALHDVYSRTVDNAGGATLTLFGKLVGIARNGVVVDATFRRYVRARISANKSSGTRDDLLKITRLIVDDENVTIEINTVQLAEGILEIYGAAVTAEVAGIVAEFIEDAISASERLDIHYGVSAPSALFQLDSGPGLDNGNLAATAG